MRNPSHLKEILLYLLIWLVIPFAALTLIQMGLDFSGVSTGTTDGLILFGKVLIFIHLLLCPIPSNIDTPREHFSPFPGASGIIQRFKGHFEQGEKPDDSLSDDG